MSVKLLSEHHLEFLSLKRGCTGSSETTLVKMSHCWKSYVTVQLFGFRHFMWQVTEILRQDQNFQNDTQIGIIWQSELPRSIPRNSVESDLDVHQ